MLNEAPYLPLSWVFLAMQIAGLAYVVSAVLMQPGMLLWPYYRLVEDLPDWLAKPLGTCEKCLSGQIALWTWVFCASAPSLFSALGLGVLFVGLAILFTHLISLYATHNAH